jgi:hypothetical protein
LKEKQIAAVLRSKTAGNDEGAAFDEHGERPDRDKGERRGGTAEIVPTGLLFALSRIVRCRVVREEIAWLFLKRWGKFTKGVVCGYV